jgi:hypothetical protein
VRVLLRKVRRTTLDVSQRSDELRVGIISPPRCLPTTVLESGIQLKLK